ncbi:MULTISPECIES: SPOR domain-containing protein [unclassified Cobetia]|uniref:SPOR domain-containing protein n=1 Tax=unclassified Cobetia TaxID=2609414 RepID=UPI00159EA32B|nr:MULTISPECIES: SPOR domain-containing protein [unclassified Cobetia]MCO7232373.1 SPOR domain-containing protein [Cobetia sp. Dlab-2-AX]MCO7235250.1 SPOR domain-containing protein [Cobetia sp. Dlab-2-U]NVN55182.1 acetyl-CoA carboxylase subunit beta [bacterium Scap17]
MKYGKRERISGAVILLALGVIFIPMLFDEPPARDERPSPVMTLGKPVDIDRSNVDEPQPPSELKIGTDVPITFVDSNGKVRDSDPGAGSDSGSESPSRVAEAEQLSPTRSVASSEPQSKPKPEPAPAAKPEPKAEPKPAPKPEPKPAVASNAPSSSAGGWAVQVGSFGDPANAERLQKELQGKGFAAYRIPRGSKLTVVFVGPYKSSEIGESARSRLQQQVNIKGLLVRRKEGE